MMPANKKTVSVALKRVLCVVAFTAVFGAPPALFAEDTLWDVTQPLGKTREIDFTTDEGTWMSVDISPDDKWIFFDLLGHIYRIPSYGGKAISLTQDSGVAINYHPRISPDGREIAFVSDRAGQDNLWIMNADGSNPRLIQLEMYARIAEPAWTPDGQHIIVTRRNKSPSGFYRTEDTLWMYPREGGKGEPLLGMERSGEAAPVRVGLWSGSSRAQWPSVSPDGNYIYFHSANFSGGERHLRRLHLKTRTVENVTETKTRYAAGVGRPAYPTHLLEVAPEISPDGRWLAFARKLPGGRTAYRGKELNGRTTLWLRDLSTGKERIIMDPISNTLAELHPSWQTRVLPGYDWASDSQSIVLSQGGKIRRLWLADGRVETIAFSARVHRIISEQARGDVTIKDDSFEAKAIRWPATSPVGNKLVFEAAGRLWLKTLPDGKPKALTNQMPDAFQLTPSWSDDGQWIAFATSSDTEGGHLWKVSAEGGVAERITDTAGRYLYPVWRENDNVLLASRWPLELKPDTQISNQWQLIRIPLKGGMPEIMTTPHLPAHMVYGNSDRYWVQSGGHLMIANSMAETPKAIASIKGSGAEAVPSPDGKWVAVRRNQDIYVTPMPTLVDSTTVVIDVAKSGKRLTHEGAYYPRWLNETTLEFSGAGSHFIYNTNTKSLKETKVNLKIPQNIAKGSIALTDARLITLDDRTIIKRGSVVIRNGRIICVGRCKTAQAEKIISLKGKTIIPGWVDTHAHHTSEEGNDGIFPQHRASSAAYLAYGVTTVFDPATAPVNPFALGELISSGRITGPRTFPTGTPLTSCRADNPIHEIDSFKDAENHINRLANLGAISIKDFKQCTRLQRTWLAEAARRRGVTLTSEGSDLNYFFGLMMTGYAGFEHPIIIKPTYSDVGRFLGQAGTHYSATFATAADYPEGSPIDYWLGQTDLWLDKKSMYWGSWKRMASRRTYLKKPIDDYGFPIQSETAADIKRNGGYGAIGAHGEQPGLDTHWEAWSYGQSLTPMEMLEAASYDGAHFLGLENEIGSISIGKLADLIVLNSNPLDDINNTTDILYVMKGGRLYEAESLDEVWPDKNKYGIRPWVNRGAIRSDVKADNYWDKQ